LILNLIFSLFIEREPEIFLQELQQQQRRFFVTFVNICFKIYFVEYKSQLKQQTTAKRAPAKAKQKNFKSIVQQ